MAARRGGDAAAAASYFVLPHLQSAQKLIAEFSFFGAAQFVCELYGVVLSALTQLIVG